MDTASKAHQGRPILYEQEVHLLLLKIADELSLQSESLFKEHGLTSTQYNVLRILRGAGPKGLACNEIGERMVSHDPDMTRLLDRLEKRELIRRERQTDDRRVIKASITGTGLETLQKLDQPVRDFHIQQFRHMPVARLKQLAELLAEVRGKNEAESLCENAANKPNQQTKEKK